MAKGPQYSDSTDVIRLLRVATWFGPACFVMLSGLWYFMWDKGWISAGVFVFLLILNVPITIGGILVIHRAVGEASVLLVKTIFADGDIAPPPTYPRQDLLVVQGKYADAADCFRDHLTIEPGDHEVAGEGRIQALQVAVPGAVGVDQDAGGVAGLVAQLQPNAVAAHAEFC